MTVLGSAVAPRALIVTVSVTGDRYPIVLGYVEAQLLETVSENAEDLP